MGRAVGLACAIHALLALATWRLAPLVAAWMVAQAPPKPDIVEFRLSEVTADVDPSSRVETAPQTPLLGEFNSVARDRIDDGADTPVPAGGEVGLDNSVPGTGQPASAPETAPSVHETLRRFRPGSDGDALPSAAAMLTGRDEPDPARTAADASSQEQASPGHGAQRSADQGEVGALGVGDYSFSTLAWDHEPYWEHMKRKLYAAWNPPAAYTQYGLLRDGGWTLVRAVVEKDGHVSKADIIDEQGHESFHRSSLAAMLGGAPFRPLPADFPDPNLVVTVRFIYLPPGRHPDAP